MEPERTTDNVLAMLREVGGSRSEDESAGVVPEQTDAEIAQEESAHLSGKVVPMKPRESASAEREPEQREKLGSD